MNMNINVDNRYKHCYSVQVVLILTSISYKNIYRVKVLFFACGEYM